MTVAETALLKHAADVVLKGTMAEILRHRRERADRILIEEVRTGRIDFSDKETAGRAAPMAISYYMATVEGAAFRNLRTLAKILVGKLQNTSLGIDDFISWKEAIASLRHEEVIFLAALLQTHKGLSIANNDSGWVRTETLKQLTENLVGPAKAFKSNEQMQAVGIGLSRTGFVVPVAAFGGLFIDPAPRLSELAEMAELQSWADDRDS